MSVRRLVPEGRQRSSAHTAKGAVLKWLNINILINTDTCGQSIDTNKLTNYIGKYYNIGGFTYKRGERQQKMLVRLVSVQHLPGPPGHKTSIINLKTLELLMWFKRENLTQQNIHTPKPVSHVEETWELCDFYNFDLFGCYHFCGISLEANNVVKTLITAACSTSRVERNKCGAQCSVLLELEGCCHGYHIRFKGCVRVRCVCARACVCGGMLSWLEIASSSVCTCDEEFPELNT